jgi:hypothetical protein
MVYNSSKEKKILPLKFQASSSKKLRSTKLYHPNHEPNNRSKNEHATLPKDDNIIAGDECSK